MSIILCQAGSGVGDGLGVEREGWRMSLGYFIDPGGFISTEVEPFRLITSLEKIPDRLRQVYDFSDQVIGLLNMSTQFSTLVEGCQLVGHGFRGDYDLLRQCPQDPVAITRPELRGESEVHPSNLMTLMISYERSDETFPYVNGRWVNLSFHTQTRRDGLLCDLAWQSTSADKIVTDRFVVRNEVISLETGQIREHDLPICISRTALSYPNDNRLILLLAWELASDYSISQEALELVNYFSRIISVGAKEEGRRILVPDDSFFPEVEIKG
jgi:hypothetical protein